MLILILASPERLVLLVATVRGGLLAGPRQASAQSAPARVAASDIPDAKHAHGRYAASHEPGKQQPAVDPCRYRSRGGMGSGLQHRPARLPEPYTPRR